MHVAVIRYFSELMFRFGTTYGTDRKTDRQTDRENRVDTTSVGLAHARPNYAWLCPWVRSSVRACVRACVRVKNGNGSRMRALPDAPSTCDQFTVTGQSTTCLYVKCEKMLALSSDYKT